MRPQPQVGYLAMRKFVRVVYMSWMCPTSLGNIGMRANLKPMCNVRQNFRAGEVCAQCCRQWATSFYVYHTALIIWLSEDFFKNRIWPKSHFGFHRNGTAPPENVVELRIFMSNKEWKVWGSDQTPGVCASLVGNVGIRLQCMTRGEDVRYKCKQRWWWWLLLLSLLEK